MSVLMIQLSPWQTTYRGTYASAAVLPVPAQIGDVAFAVSEFALYAFSGAAWVAASGSVDTSTFVLTDGSHAMTGTLITPGVNVAAPANMSIGAGVGANSLTLGGATSTVVIPGDLHVLGVSKKIQSTDLDITDKFITLNKGGNDATSVSAGLVIERTGTSGSLIFSNALNSKWAAGALGGEIELVNLSSSQTLTNKTIAAGSNSITGLADANITAGAAIDASKISTGAVSNTEFLYLDGVTSSIQTQLTSNASSISTHTGASSGVHGVTGSVVGTSDTQTLTSKTLAVGSNSITSTAYQTAVFSAAGNLASISTGTAGQFLKSAGNASLPSYASISQSDVSGLTTASDVTFNSLTLTAGLVGASDGSDAAAGKVGEKLTAEQATFTATGVAATGVFGNAISRSFTAGRWLIYGSLGVKTNGAVMTTGIEGAISTSSSGAGLTANDKTVLTGIDSGNDVFSPVPQQYFSFAGTTTVYLNTKLNYSSGSPQHQGRITGIRL